MAHFTFLKHFNDTFLFFNFHIYSAQNNLADSVPFYNANRSVSEEIIGGSTKMYMYFCLFHKSKMEHVSELLAFQFRDHHSIYLLFQIRQHTSVTPENRVAEWHKMDFYVSIYWEGVGEHRMTKLMKCLTPSRVLFDLLYKI